VVGNGHCNSYRIVTSSLHPGRKKGNRRTGIATARKKEKTPGSQQTIPGKIILWDFAVTAFAKIWMGACRATAATEAARAGLAPHFFGTVSGGSVPVKEG
jgi:hypothetical protein